VGEGSSFRTLDLSAAEREAVGRAELARLDAVCRQHGVALHTWLGGALRPRVSFAVAMPLDAVTAVAADVRRVALVSGERDVARRLLHDRSERAPSFRCSPVDPAANRITLNVSQNGHPRGAAWVAAATEN